jgi:CelD/BcsL family acetyltransferase involved in cellulose biosynthesis
MLRRFGEAGGAELWLLRLDGRAVAYRIGFRDGPRFVECDIAYDQEYRPFSPGTLLAVECNERLIHEGVEEINLGMAFGWKDEWSPEPRRRVEAQILPRKPYSLLLRAAQALRSRLASARADGHAD